MATAARLRRPPRRYPAHHLLHDVGARPPHRLGDLGQGFPDADGPPSVIAAAVRSARAGANQYAPGLGVPALRHAIARHQQERYGIELDPDTQVVVTTRVHRSDRGRDPGTRRSRRRDRRARARLRLLRRVIQMAGGVRRPVMLAPRTSGSTRTTAGRRHRPDRFVLLNSPHNPTGTVLTATSSRGRRGRDRARPGGDHRRGLRAPHLHRVRARADRHAAGHGRADADPVERRQELLVHRVEGRLGHGPASWWVRCCRPSSGDVHLGLAAAAGGRRSARTSTRLPAALAAELEGKRDLLCTGLEKVGLPGRPPAGTYFATSDISHLGWPDAMAFCLALPERAGVVAIPTQVFYDDPDAGRQLVRWAFCKQSAGDRGGPEPARRCRPGEPTPEGQVSPRSRAGEPLAGAAGEDRMTTATQASSHTALMTEPMPPGSAGPRRPTR